MKNVSTWKQAIDDGKEPMEYPFNDIEPGEYKGMLDFKIWAKKVMAVNCYFTLLDSGRKVQLTVFSNDAGVYKLNKSEINFSSCPLNVVYRLVVVESKKTRKVYLADAELIEAEQEEKGA